MKGKKDGLLRKLGKTRRPAGGEDQVAETGR